MAKIDFGDGQVVELSKETTKRLRKELLKPAPPRDFEDGLLRMRIVERDMLEIDSDYECGASTYVVRSLHDVIVIRNQLNVFIDYLKEIQQ